MALLSPSLLLKLVQSLAHHSWNESSSTFSLMMMGFADIIVGIDYEDIYVGTDLSQ